MIELIPRAEQAYRKMVRDLPAMLAKEPDKARAIRARIFGRIERRRTEDGGMVEVLEMSPAQLISLVEGSGNWADDNAGSGGRI